jgi:uncharacterized protein YndB with AHSA1/START domain
MTDSPLTHSLARRVLIRASRDIVFSYFTDPARWEAWWGAGSTIDARPGGRMSIVYPNGVTASGEVVEVVAPERIVFTYGYESGQPIAPGASRVTIALSTKDSATQLDLTHDFREADVRDQHVQGWRYQLSMFSNLVANDLHANAAEAVDAWFAAWSNADAASRARTLSRVCVPEVEFRDRHSALTGIEDLVAHAGAALQYNPSTLERRGAVRHCQGMVLADWRAVANGTTTSEGTNVFILAPNDMIEWVTGFWTPPAQ